MPTSPNVPLSYNTYHDQPDPNGAGGYSQQYNTDQYQSTVYPLVPHSFNTNNDRSSDASYRPPPLTAQTSWAPTFDAASSSRRLGNTRYMGAEEGSRDGYWGMLRHSNHLYPDAPLEIDPYMVPRVGSLGLRSNSISSSITDTSNLSSLSSGDRATNFHDPNAYTMHSYDPGLSQGYQYPGGNYYYPTQYPYPSFHAETYGIPRDAYAYPAPYLSFTNPYPETYPTSQFRYPQTYSSIPYNEGLPPTSDPDVTSSNLGSYEYPTSYAPILQPTPVSAEAQYQVQDLLGSNPSLNTGTQLTPRANPPPDLPNAFPRTPTIHGPFPPQTSHPSIPPQEIAASAKNKATIPSNEGFASNLKKKFSTSSANIIRRVSDMKDKEAELARPTKSRQYWPSKYEAEVFTEEDMKLPAAKRRRIYINSLEQYCNTLNELMRVHGLLAEPKPFAKEVKNRDTKLVAVALENRIVNLRNHLAALSRASLLNPNATLLEPDPHLPHHPFSQTSRK